MKEKHNIGTVLQMYKFTMAGITLALAISSLTTFTHAESIKLGVFSKYSEPYGIPYKEWIIKWWQWNISIPEADHPYYDITGEKCAVGQEGRVWFLSDHAFSADFPIKELTCTIPTEKAILFPTQTGECDYGMENMKTDESVQKCAIEGNDFAAITVTIDGVRLQNLEQYRILSDFFNIRIPEDNVYGTAPGTFKAMVDGFFVFLEPLPPGKHNIRFTVNVNNPLDEHYNLSKDITYHLIVKP